MKNIITKGKFSEFVKWLTSMRDFFFFFAWETFKIPNNTALRDKVIKNMK